MTAEHKANGQAASQPNFAIQTLYVKDISLETPNSPQIFRENWQPNVNLDLNINSNCLDPDVYEVVLHMTVTAKNAEKVAFLVEVQQAGIFTIQGFPEEQLSHMLGSYCPNLLYPYAREVITDIINRAGFPKLYLAPINFDALYQQKMEEQEGVAGGQGQAAGPPA